MNISVAQDLAEKGTAAIGRWMREKLFRCTTFHNGPGIHEHDALCDLARETHFVGDNHHGHSFFGYADHDVEHFADHLGGEGCCRLIKQHDLGSHAKATGNSDPLLLSAGELRWVSVELVGEPNSCE